MLFGAPHAAPSTHRWAPGSGPGLFPVGGASNSGVPRAAERAGPTPTGKKSGRRPRGAVPAAPRGSTGVLMAQLAQVSRSPVETHRTGLLVPAGEDRVLP